MKAVLMAGGFGTRIQPLTHSVPKPMVPLLNRPMMEHIVVRLKDAGITDLVVLLYYMPEVIRDHFGDGGGYGVNIEYVLPEDDFGTAGAIKQAEALLDDTFLVMSGDVINDFDLGAIEAFHRSKQTPATLTLTSVPNPLQFGVVITDEGGRILRFLEKPGWGEVFSDTVNTGIYVLEPEVLARIPESRPFDFSKDLFPSFLEDDVAIFGCNTPGYWRDVGDPDSYRDAVRDGLGGKVVLSVPGSARPVGGGAVWAHEELTLPPGLEVRGAVVLGADVELGENVRLEDTVIGPGCRVGSGSNLENAVLWKGVEVGTETRLRDVVLCDRVRVGNGVRIEKGAVVAEGTEIGDGASLERDILVWPDKKVEAGSVLAANLVWGDKWKKSVFEGARVEGRTNVELSPGFAAKLGAALGSTLPRGSALLVGRDYLRASRMLKRSFLGGVLSTGVNVHDAKMLPVPVQRYKLSSFGERGGVYFQQSPTDRRSIQVVFYDGEGNRIDTGLEKSIERLFFKENFRRVDHAEVGEIQEIPALDEFYREAYLRAVDHDAVRSRRFRVVLDLANGTAGDHLPGLLNSLGCQLVALNSYPDERRLMRRMAEADRALIQMGKIVKAVGADLGFYVTPGAQNLKIVDDRGRVRDPHESLLFVLKLLALTRPEGTRVFLPVTAPRALDGEEPGLVITRGKVASLKTAAMHEYGFISEAIEKYAFPDFLHAPDGMFASARILELLARAGLKASEVFDALPTYTYRHRELPCPVEAKGRVMRRMSEDSVDKEACFTDGVQIGVGAVSVLLLPDPFRPVVHLVSEGVDGVAVDRELAAYAEKAARWIGS